MGGRLEPPTFVVVRYGIICVGPIGRRFRFCFGAAHCVTVESVVDFGCCCGVYDASMRDRSITVVGVVASCLLLVACGGSGGDASASTAAASTTAVVVVTAPPASSTAAPTTTIDDTAAQLAAAEQAYLDAFDAYIAAARDPANPELRAEIERLYTGPNLELTTQLLDNLVRQNRISRPASDPSRTVIVAAPAFLPDRTDFAELVVCEVDTERYVEIGGAPDGSDALVTDAVTITRLLVRFENLGGEWKSNSGEVLAVLSASEDCDQ
jgi:hypothetical protein